MTTKRAKPARPAPRLRDLPDVDGALYEMAQATAEIKQLEAVVEARINDLKEAYKQKAQPLVDRIKALELDVLAFAEDRKPDLFSDKRSLELTFGEIGFRRSTRISVRQDTLALLKELGWEEGIRVEESVNKEKLTEWSDEQLARVHASRTELDKFWYELHELDAVEQVPATASV